MGIHYDYKSTRGDKAMKKEAKILSNSLHGYLNIYKNHMMTAVRALDYFNNINSGKICTEQGCNIDEAKN